MCLDCWIMGMCGMCVFGGLEGGWECGCGVWGSGRVVDCVEDWNIWWVARGVIQACGRDGGLSAIGCVGCGVFEVLKGCVRGGEGWWDVWMGGFLSFEGWWGCILGMWKDRGLYGRGLCGF